MIYVKRIILLVLIFNLHIFAKDIRIRGKAIKLLDIGKRTIYFNNNGEDISIHMPKKNNKLITKGTIYRKGNLKFKKSISSDYVGQELQFRVVKDWFIISPFNGKFFLPRYSSSINIVMIPKNSQIYLELFKVVDYYTIQVFVTRSPKKAEQMVRSLQEFCKKDTKKSPYYCNKYVKKIPVIAPNRDPLYKIYYNRYNSYDEAKKNLEKVKNKNHLHDALIFQHTVIDTDFFK